MPAHQLPPGYSYPLSLQQVVDLGVAQVIAQGFNSSLSLDEMDCRYRGAEDRACHIGACLPLDVAEDWDERRVGYRNWGEDLPEFFAASSQSLREFQAIHDNWLQPKLPGTYARRVEEFCMASGLVFPKALAPYLIED